MSTYCVTRAFSEKKNGSMYRSESAVEQFTDIDFAQDQFYLWQKQMEVFSDKPEYSGAVHLFSPIITDKGDVILMPEGEFIKIYKFGRK